MFDIDLLRNFVTFIGIYVLGIYLIENLKSLLSIVRSVLEPYFLPHIPTSLVEKYGTWAGELVFFICLYEERICRGSLGIRCVFYVIFGEKKDFESVFLY